MEKVSKTPIKPLFAHSITLQNLPKYQDLIKRRYKTTLNFRFTCPEKPSYHATGDNKITQNKLFRALKNLKVIKKVDLSSYKVETFHLVPHKTLTIYKRMQKIKQISVCVSRRADSLIYNNFKEGWLRYLPALRDLDYELAGKKYPSTQDLQEARNAKDVENPLRDIKYCPKIQSLQIKVPNHAKPFLKSLYDFKKYPSSIKHLAVSPEFTFTEDPNSSIDSLKNLQSLQLKFHQTLCPDFTIRNINSLLNLANLKELDLKFLENMIPEIYTVFGKISEKGTLKKVKLEFEKNYQFAGVLEALKNCQLTNFSLKGVIFDEKLIEPIAKFLQGRTQLECLDIQISHEYLFKERNIFESVCKEINKLPALRNLSLNFYSAEKITKKTPLLAFTSYLQPTLSKPIKLEALSLECNQVDPSEEFQSLMAGLKDSTNSLRKLKVNLGVYCPTKQVHDNVTSFIKSLENIRVLDLPNLDIGVQKFLNDFVETVHDFKFLQILIIGSIKGIVTKPLFLDSVESIVKKRGLVKFQCTVALDFMRTLLKKSKTAPRVDLSRVQKINPALEEIPSVYFVFDEDLFDRTWFF